MTNILMAGKIRRLSERWQ